MEGLAEVYAGLVERDADLAPLSSFRLGGPADWLFTPVNEAELGELLRFLAGASVPITVIGEGSNILVRDGGIRGAVIRIGRAFSALEWRGDEAICGAGLPSAALAKQALAEGRGGFAWAAALPGNIGGALCGNAGAFGGELAEHFAGLRAFDPLGGALQLGKGRIDFGYRMSSVPQDIIVTEVTLSLPELEGEVLEMAQALYREVLARRSETQPKGRWTAGCTFKNPAEVPAGKLIDDCGLKGERIGGARVSDLHANFIVVEEGARAADVEALIARVREKVQNEHGIVLETEIKIYGEA